MIQPLLDKKVILVTGKGGTGKTTLSAGLAIAAARRRKRVLLAEIDMTRPSVEDIFGKPLSYTPTRLADHLEGMNIEFYDALHAYLGENIGVDMVVSAILRNKVVRYFLDSTPFARELAFLNTIYQYFEKAISGTGHDLVIVDLPATGHAYSMLAVPQSVVRMFKVGPMLKRARDYQTFLADKRVALCMVTLAEEMPVSETIEAYQKMQQELPVHFGPIFLNRLPVAQFSQEEASLIRSLRARQELSSSPRINAILAAGEEAAILAERGRRQLERLEQGVPGPFIQIPELEAPHTEPAAHRLARALEQL